METKPLYDTDDIFEAFERRYRLKKKVNICLSILIAILGITILAYITADYSGVGEYFLSPRVWQYFLYHSMVVTLGLYLGFGSPHRASPSHFKNTMGLLAALDFPTFYLNSVYSQPVYADGKPTGLVYRAIFFSSYVNPLGLVLSQKWQWLLYLVIRLTIATAVVALLLGLSGRKCKF